MGAQYKSLLFYCNFRWFSRENVVVRVYDLREESALFLEEENQEIAEYFRSETFLLKLAYLSNIFEKLNLLNTSMQGCDTNILVVSDKVNVFVRKMSLWISKIEERNLNMFSESNAFTEDNNMEISETGIERCIREHPINLQSSFSKYFPEKMNDKYSWFRDPFHEVSPPNNDFSLEEEENYIDLTSDTSLKLRFRRESLTEFWVGVEEECPHLSKKVINILLPFATSYLCQTGFSGVAALKTKYCSMLNIKSDLRVAISRLQPRYETSCCKKQPYTSH
jgi:hypothetical protein